VSYSAFVAKPQSDSLIVVDLGYSATRPSCGLCWSGAERAVELQFGETIRQVAKIASEINDPVLVIEAVLSTYHAPSGNPDIRGDFERGRGWYYGAGVLSFAAAQRFLKVLDGQLKGRRLRLAEAFLSNKDTPTGHAEDAEMIRDQFQNTQTAALRDGVEASLPLIDGCPSVRVFSLVA
jgi:hypothetical protein